MALAVLMSFSLTGEGSVRDESRGVDVKLKKDKNKENKKDLI